VAAPRRAIGGVRVVVGGVVVADDDGCGLPLDEAAWQG
jgi:hypothetical protein